MTSHGLDVQLSWDGQTITEFQDDFEAYDDFVLEFTRWKRKLMLTQLKAEWFEENPNEAKKVVMTMNLDSGEIRFIDSLGPYGRLVEPVFE